GTRAAIEVQGSGSIDLGTTISPGGNTLAVHDGGLLIRNETNQDLRAFGNFFLQDDEPIDSTDLVALAGLIFDRSDDPAKGGV
ncbi:hypothetical protein ACSNOK_35525, partial [Streptomyces sp. URMC 126]|uniref:hypothetical protein n=1 Tax=Streptomyces sp. URMC 126 TaxID=3423401 RepID=UPI003F1E2AE3